MFIFIVRLTWAQLFELDCCRTANPKCPAHAQFSTLLRWLWHCTTAARHLVQFHVFRTSLIKSDLCGRERQWFCSSGNIPTTYTAQPTAESWPYTVGRTKLCKGQSGNMLGSPLGVPAPKMKSRGQIFLAPSLASTRGILLFLYLVSLLLPELNFLIWDRGPVVNVSKASSVPFPMLIHRPAGKIILNELPSRPGYTFACVASTLQFLKLHSFGEAQSRQNNRCDKLNSIIPSQFTVSDI